MRPLYCYAWGLALLAVSGTSARAAWNNVFQVACNHGRAPAPVVAGFAGDPCCPQPVTSCTTRYVQRSFYQPVTTYRTSTVLQPVTTYRTSYYWEPVTTVRYSCYFDPCTCRYQSVATPVTSYQLRSRCCPVTSYLQRTCMTPVTSYQLSYYYEPVTTCCTTTTGAPVAAPPPAAAAPPPAAAESRDSLPPPPPGTTNPPPNASESRESGTTRFLPERNPSPTPPGAMPPVGDGASRRPAVRLDRIASTGGQDVAGRVLDGSRTPRRGARVLFVNVEQKSDQRTATADVAGAFRTRLAAGGWLVYTYDAQGRPVFSRRIEVPSDRGVSMTLVNR